MDKCDKRFSGVLGEEYALLLRAIPHYDKLEDTVLFELRKYTQLYSEQDDFEVIEIGCGTGYTTIRILDADPRIHIKAVDSEETMIRQAREAFADLLERIEFFNSDALKFLSELPKNSVDVIASAFAIHNFAPGYRERFFGEVARVLKIGGLFVNADKYARNDEEAHRKDLNEQIINLSAIGQEDLERGWKKHYEEDELVKFTEAEQVEMLLSLGFKNIEVVFRERMEATISGVRG